MSDKTGGFFSSVGRFFSGGSASKNNEAEKSPSKDSSESRLSSLSPLLPSTAPPPALLKDIISIDDEAPGDLISNGVQSSLVGSQLRYLSPSALASRTTASNGLEVDVEAESDIFFSTPSVSTNRKRQLTELDKQSLPQTFRSDSVKRSRFLNRSLLEPTIKGSLIGDKRLDMSWCGELTSNHSPASSITNFSLLSRHSEATSNGSLSTRTQEIFRRLDGTNTPAKEVQRMSMLRPGLSRPERWSSNEKRDLDVSSIGTPPPPLKKAGDAIPSRIQLISKSMGVSARRSPYWTDLTRRRTSSKNGDNATSETSSLRLLNGTLASAELSSVFSLEVPAPKKTSSSMSTASTTTIDSSNIKKPHASIIKGPDGKPVSRNTFKLNDDVDEESSEQNLPPLPVETLSNPKPLKLAPGSSLKEGFLDKLAFSFNAPVDIASLVGAKTRSDVSSVRSSESKEVDSDSAESIGKQTSESCSSESDSEESVDGEVVDEVKESRPHTSADTVSTVSNSSNQSSENSSPKVSTGVPLAEKAPAKWLCDACFTSWDQSLSECGACGGPRPGAGISKETKPQEKQLVSNLKNFAPQQPSSFKFGFGEKSAAVPPTFTSSSSSSSGSTEPATSSTTSTSLEKTTPASVNFSAVPQPTPALATSTVTATAKPSTGDRVDWECPDCMVSNKSTDDKCPCCQYEKYPSTTSSSNVFGNRAFKPSSGVSSQFGITASSTPKPMFGFGNSKPAEPSPAVTSVFSTASGASGLLKDNSSIPVSNISSKETEPAKTVGSLFGNFSKSSDSISSVPAAPVFSTPATTSSIFSTNPSSNFGTPSTETAQKDGAKPSMFGTLNTETATIKPVATVSAPLITSTNSLFGSSTIAPAFGSGSLFGTQKPPVEEPKSTPTLPFGGKTSSSSTEPSSSLFGNIKPPAPSTTTSTTTIFGQAQTPSTNLFATNATDSTTSSVFGKPIQFSGEVETTTTDGGVPAKRGLFTSSGPKLTFGGDQNSEKPKFGGFGSGTASSTSSTASGNVFSNSNAAPLFGGSSTGVPAFTSSTSTTVPVFGSSSTKPFGTSAPTTGFGVFGSKPSQPGMSTSSSTNSLFSQGPDASNPFGGSTGNNGFNFGATSSTGSTGGSGVFQFGGSVSTAPAPSTSSGGPFQFGNNLAAPAAPAPGSMDNAFAYQPSSSVGARKMAMARRRNMRK
ncbi:CBN-NPP-7 protein [Caenorhabditis brenneri]|uniref:CBN-NPP-7 protein n=1 Tax=Caenorhabditis brenneri TaxID=135651 RepID=G0MNK7_CAEBE|nr:CBN-NPP-7 protein [Caenorhabditis brenneri]